MPELSAQGTPQPGLQHAGPPEVWLDRYRPALVLFVIGVAIQTLYFLSVPITSTLDSAGYANILIDNVNGVPKAFPTFYFFSVIAELFPPNRLAGLILIQSLMAALIAPMLYLAVREVSTLAALLAAAIILISFNPFFYSTWLMLEQIYLFCVALIIFCFSIFMERRSARWAAALGVSLALGEGARSNGIVFPGVAAIAIAILIAFCGFYRTPAFIRRVFLAGLIFLIAGYMLDNMTTLTGVKGAEPVAGAGAQRFLFCNVYGHATEGFQERRAQLTSESAAPIRRVLADSQDKHPAIFNSFANRYPAQFAQFAGNPQALVDAFVENRPGGPTMQSTNHIYCWYILETMDAELGPIETNKILGRLWREFLFEQHIGWRHYAMSLGEYFFQNPDSYYHGSYGGAAPQINPYTVTPAMWAALAESPDGALQRKMAPTANAYWLGFFLIVTPWISAAALLGLFGLLFPRAAPLSLFMLGLAVAHGLVNAVTNTTDARYVSMVYPALCGLAGIGLVSAALVPRSIFVKV